MTTILAITLSLIIILIAGLLLLFYWTLVFRPHPRLTGKLELDGLEASVEVIRDQWGVPHLYAATESDLWFAQGFVHAQDRLWQMEQLRRVAAGRMSEGVGEEGLAIDRLARIIGFRRTAIQQEAGLDPDVAAMLARYIAGVNAFLQRYRRRLPLEFTLLKLQPEPWTAADTLSVSLLLGWVLTTNWREELARVGLAVHLGPKKAAELLPELDPDNPGVLPGSPISGLAELLLAAYEQMSDTIGLRYAGQGSNNWVIDGSKSITGQPLLANDPHLAVTMPGFWHLIHLEAGKDELRLIGAGLPGAPGIVLGHNARIAWGATAAFPDSSDLYVEQQHPQNPRLFRFGDDWEEAQVFEEIIRVRGRSEPVVQQVTITRHGPLLSDWLAEHEREYPPLALRWVGFEPRPGLNGWARILRASDWESFRRGAGDILTPALSFVYADGDGNIGYIAGGSVPIRQQGRGLVPSPGFTGDHEWLGFIPIDALPQRLNPDEGFLLSANQRLVGDDYPYWWGIDHFPGYRARRIAELLQARPRLSLRDFQTMQQDTYSTLGRALAPYFTLLDPTDPWERRAQRAVLEWNYRMEADSTAALVFELTLIHLVDILFGASLGANANAYKGISRLPGFEPGAFAYNAIEKVAELMQHETDEWFGTDAGGHPRTREDVLGLALQRAVHTMRDEISDNARLWQWGRLHQIAWLHPLGVFKPLRRLLNRGPFPTPGSGLTINAQHIEPRFPLKTVTVAPTYRMILDVANWDRSVFVVCPGQSGLPGHRFYDNLMHIWLEGETIPMAFSRAKVEQSDPIYHLTLQPLR